MFPDLSILSSPNLFLNSWAALFEKVIHAKPRGFFIISFSK